MPISRITEANLRRFENFPFDCRETRIEKVIRILSKLRPQRLLDLECGNGYIVVGLHPKPDSVVGCEHLIATDGLLRECARVLRPEGYLLLTTPNLASFDNRLRLLTGFYPTWVDYTLDEGCGHVRAYTPRVLKEHARQKIHDP